MAEPKRVYRGPTYYDQPQLKPSPFGWKVWLYVFLSGLSGSSQILAAAGDLFGSRAAQGMVRRARNVAMLGATIGPVLLIADLQTPQRFYNMLRIFKPTSPMSIGTYILTSFSLFSFIASTAQFVSDLVSRGPRKWLRTLARAAQIPAALAGGGMGVYTASLQSATSTPLWAASPRWLAVRYGSSSMASAAAALSLAERAWGNRRTAERLDAIALGALIVELAAILASEQDYKRERIARVSDSGPLRIAESVGAMGLGTLLPIALHSAAMLSRRAGGISRAASVGTLLGRFALCWTVMVAGNESARRPAISFAFTQPRNAPRL